MHGTPSDGRIAHPDAGDLFVLPLAPGGDERPGDGPRPMALVLGIADEDAFDPVVARLVAVQVAVLLCGTRRVAGLRRALESRDLIGQAKGIVMEREGVDAPAAFRVLAEASQHANLKLTSVARWLVEEAAGRDAPDARRAGEPGACERCHFPFPGTGA